MDFGILFSGLGGIFTGLVGPIVKSVMAYKQQKSQFEHEEKMVKLESDAKIAEVQAEIKKTETITEGQVKVAEVGALTEALKAADRPVFVSEYMRYLIECGSIGKVVAAFIAFLLACVEVLRQSIRPTTTIYMLGVTTWITVLAYRVLQATQQAITVDFAQEIFRMLIYTAVYLTVSAINFWFVNREDGLIKKLARKV